MIVTSWQKYVRFNEICINFAAKITEQSKICIYTFQKKDCTLAYNQAIIIRIFYSNPSQ